MSESIERVGAARDTLRRYWAGRRTLLLVQTFNATVGTTMRELASFGAEVRGVVTANPPGHDAPEVPHVHVCGSLSTAEFDQWLQDPPPDFTRWLDELDPRREWTFLGTTFTHTSEVCGRRVHGWRRPEWARLEDKTVIDGLWRQVGVPAPRHVVSDVDDPRIPAFVRELDNGAGVVLAMDSTNGFVGDAKGLRWVRTAGELGTALEACRTSANRLRVAEFVPGVPCSVLGMVLADGVAVFDPLEIVTLRDRTRAGLVFCGSSTHWRPDGEQLRHYTRLAGEELAASVGYRGLFSVDGILGADGFVATELNPRHASGLGLRAGWPEFPLYSFQRGVQEGLRGLFDLGHRHVEAAFRAVVRETPSLAVRVPAPGASGDGRFVTGTGQIVDYRVAGGAAWLDRVSPPAPGGVVGPAAAEVATALGAGALTSFRDDYPEEQP
ncbi:hypothetical protein [Amycolatopsis sp. cmx-4-61]|uniref:hypothetical protein n=1 Tax=Amycolatopsis sp. cmx-4-61 TaxID=2790937 RepID=UPI00397C712D